MAGSGRPAAAFYIDVLVVIGGLVYFAGKQAGMFGEPAAQETGSEESLINQCMFMIQCRLVPWKYAPEARQSMAYRLSDRALRLFCSGGRRSVFR